MSSVDEQGLLDYTVPIQMLDRSLESASDDKLLVLENVPLVRSQLELLTELADLQGAVFLSAPDEVLYSRLEDSVGNKVYFSKELAAFRRNEGDLLAGLKDKGITPLRIQTQDFTSDQVFSEVKNHYSTLFSKY